MQPLKLADPMIERGKSVGHAPHLLRNPSGFVAPKEHPRGYQCANNIVK